MMQNLNDLYPSHFKKVLHLYEKEMADLGYDWLMIDSGTHEYRFQDDMMYPFRINPHFNYFVPVNNQPDSYIILQPGKKPVLLYYQASDFWYPVPESPESFWADQFQLEIIESPEAIRKYIPANTAAAVYLGSSGVRFKQWGIRQINPQHLLNRLHFHRAKKTDFEVACMREATRLAVLGHQAARNAFFSGGSEFDCHLAYLKACQHMELDLPYGNIVAFNEHASILHYPLTDKVAPADTHRHSFLLDAGANYRGYAADITRTYSYRPDEFGELITAMDWEQQALIARMKNGESYADTHLRAHESVGKLLRQFGFSGESAETLVETGVTSTFFPHGIGHLLGLQVHDIAGHAKNAAGDLYEKPAGHPFLRLTRTIEPGFVFTIEPGLYFIDPLLKTLNNGPNAGLVNWDKIDSFRKYGGIRIEDNILMTTHGPVNMTREDMPKP